VGDIQGAGRAGDAARLAHRQANPRRKAAVHPRASRSSRFATHTMVLVLALVIAVALAVLAGVTSIHA
jgi:hypothetical protein